MAGKIKNSSEVIKIDRSILSFFFFLKKLNSILKFYHSLPDWIETIRPTTTNIQLDTDDISILRCILLQSINTNHEGKKSIVGACGGREIGREELIAVTVRVHSVTETLNTPFFARSNTTASSSFSSVSWGVRNGPIKAQLALY